MTTRRSFLRECAALAAGAPVLGAPVPERANSAPEPDPPRRSASGSQRRWRVAFGLNGFMSSESVFGKTFPIWEVLAFAEREGFEAIELVEGWPKGCGLYPDPDDGARIAGVKDLCRRYGVKPFSIQTGAAGAFRKDRSAREAWLRQFAGWARFARKAGCECIGTWPGGDLDGQTIDEAIDVFAGTLREVAKIVSDEELLCSVEIEPPFVFNRIEHLVRIVDGAGHPLVKGMYDPSHFDLMDGSRGKPHELLERFGVQRVGYVHFTDTDGTIFQGTSKHLPCGDGHIDVRRSLEVLWDGGYEGWIMIDAWMTEDPYDACRKGKAAIEAARREFAKRLSGT
ncbi:MAG: sugar phosphate isomerase/epimerase family protein [Planctomycetota bacterium]